MLSTAVTPEEFFPDAADPAVWDAIAAFDAIQRAERDPHDPPRSAAEIRANMQAVPDFVTVRRWHVWDAAHDALLGMAIAMTIEAENNRHLLEFSATVRAEARRRGIGRALLARAAEHGAATGRTLLLAGTDSRVPAGEAFMRRIGAEVGMQAVTNELRLADLDRQLMQRWVADGAARAGSVALGFWDGPYPDADLDAVVAVKQVMNSAPTDDLDVEDMNWTAAQLRAIEGTLWPRGIERWTLYARDTATGALAGYTELLFVPARPDSAEQGDTAVVPAYRGRGIGRWLKAAMIEKVLAERPHITTVQTGNANSNAPMLKINHEMGFREHHANLIWQVPLTRVQAYLGEGSAEGSAE